MAGVVTAAGLDFVSLLGVKLKLAERSILGGVGRCIAEVVLAAEFVGDLVEGFLELVELVANFNDAPASFVGEFFHLRVAGVTETTVESAVCNQNHIDDGVRFLCGLDRVADAQLTALIFPIRKKNHGFASDFVRELIVRREVHGVVKQRAARSAGGNRAGTHFPSL